MSNHETERIIRVAASLHERIGMARRDAEEGGSALAAVRLRSWSEQAAGGNLEKFDRRLAWQALDRENAARLLGQHEASFDGAEPAWAAGMRRLLEFLDSAPAVPSLALEFAEPVVFSAALAPLVAFGMQWLAERIPAVQLTENVAASVRRGLSESISHVCSLALGEEFERYRRAHNWMPGSGEGSTELYDAFVTSMGPGGWRRLFGVYPVLARLAAIQVGHWLDDTVEFLDRLSQDAPGIELRFFAGRLLPPVRWIQTSISEPHDGGRAVRIAEFEDGRKIVYKPHSLAMDEAWLNLTGWLAEQEDFFRVRSPVAWNRGGYGWAEFIETAACADAAGLQRFYSHSGALICLLYAIRGTDFHHENLIAAGEYPTPVDLETLFVPSLKPLSSAEGGDELRGIVETVLQTLLLPAWMAFDGKIGFDISGLGGLAAEQAAGEGEGWSSMNTDAMRYEKLPAKVVPARNYPSAAGEAADPIDFLPEVAGGFERAYRGLVRHRDALLAPGGPIARFRSCPGRAVLRATHIYARLLRRSLAPRFLRNGLDRSLELEGLAAAFLGPGKPPEHGRIFLAEVEALEQLDVPRFATYPEMDSLELGDTRLAALLKEPGFAAVVARVRGLDEEDLRCQLELIRASFAVRDLRAEAAGQQGRAGLPTAPAELDQASPPDAAGLLARARGIADQIAQRAVWKGETAWWLGVEFNHIIHRHTVQPLGASLYGGRAGVALFCAALYAVGGRDPEHRRLALGAARSVRRNFWGPDMDADAAALAAQTCGIGMGGGIAGIAYALLLSGLLLDDASLVEDAVRAGRLISESLIAADEGLDVLGGSAGAILALVPLWEASGDPVFLDRVAICADRLVATQLSGSENSGGWPTLDAKPLAGFSHGAAGIALALTRAALATGTSSYRDAAGRGIAYERSVFLPAEDNWRDFRVASEQGPVMASWCHGAPGIGLARLGCLASAEGDAMRMEIETAARWLLTHPLSGVDHLCCGDFGKLELLLEGGRRLARPDWIEAARRRAAAMMARAGKAGFAANIGGTDAMFIPGFFIGLAGIGYQMLRLADARLPSVLLWEMSCIVEGTGGEAAPPPAGEL